MIPKGFPDMPCMKMVYKRQIGVVTLASNQEQRALFVPLINPWSTAGFVPSSVYLRFALFVLPNGSPPPLFLIRQRVKGTVVSWANRHVGVPFCPAPTRLWYVRVLDSTSWGLGFNVS